MPHSRTSAPRRAFTGCTLCHGHAPRAALLLAALGLAACADDTLPSGPEAPVPAQSQAELTAEAVPNTWATTVSMPTARRGLVAATVNNVIYAIGGLSSGESNRAVQAYYGRGRLHRRPCPSGGQGGEARPARVRPRRSARALRAPTTVTAHGMGRSGPKRRSVGLPAALGRC